MNTSNGNHADSERLQNLGGNITRARQRLASLSGQPADTAIVTAGATATARAGLTITTGMTTPSRPGKQPRPVWNVRGNMTHWRPMLIALGGNWYHGAFSFWDDPTTDIEDACSKAEQGPTTNGELHPARD